MICRDEAFVDFMDVVEDLTARGIEAGFSIDDILDMIEEEFDEQIAEKEAETLKQAEAKENALNGVIDAFTAYAKITGLCNDKTENLFRKAVGESMKIYDPAKDNKFVEQAQRLSDLLDTLDSELKVKTVKTPTDRTSQIFSDFFKTL